VSSTVHDFTNEFRRYRTMAEKAIAQVSDEGLNRVPAADANSIAMLVRHISGNLQSRFTDFLSSDGEKAWRHRDDEFVERSYTRDETLAMWNAGWQVLDAQLAALTDDDLSRSVTIRGELASAHEALCRALAHIASHVGQIILLARLFADADWSWITIPKRRLN
jgi:hypothetical protein